MSDKILTVSLSPHIRGEESVKRLMYSVIIALIPALAISLYFFGLGAFVVTLLAIVSCVGFEYLISRYVLKTSNTILAGSAVITGLLLAFNVPSNLPWWMVIIGSAVAIGIAKMTFGGLGNNPFNPALIGRVFLLISFPEAMTSWPTPSVLSTFYIDAETGPTALAIIKEGLKKGETVPTLINGFSYIGSFIGEEGGSMGEVSVIALLIGGIYLLIRRVITWHIPVSMLASVFIFTGLLWLINPLKFADPLFHILTGGVIIGAFFMATDYVTSPMTPKGMLLFGAGIGILTVIIRVWGAYPEGVSFAILIMNALVPLINKYIKPKRFGEKSIPK